MKLYKIRPYFDGVEGEVRFVPAWDEADARSEIEESGVLMYDAYQSLKTMV